MAIPGNFLSTVTESIDPNTSGWAAKANCTIGLGSGGRNGDGCLAVKSVAAGEMQVRTVSSYAVDAGTAYQAFADASAGTQPERIGIRWLSSANTELSITWSLTTAAASATWHRIGVAAPAPSGAVRAQVVLSATVTAANVLHYFENVYFGLPATTPGNLFGFNTESSEIDASGWFAEVNATISRQAPAVSWAVDYYLAGGQVIAMTATGAGNASIRSTDRPTAVPGVEYIAYCYLNPPTMAATTWVELRFYDAPGNQIAATRSVLAAPGTGWYRQRASAVAPANTVSCSIAVGIDGASAGQVLRAETVVVSTAPLLHAGTVVPYADGSLEQDVAGWTTVSGAAVVSRSTPWGAYFFDGAYAGTITSATATTSVIRSAKFTLPAGAAGLSFRSQVIAQVTAGGFTLTRAVRWYSATNTDLGTTASAAATAPTPGWWQLLNDFTAPAGAAKAAIEWTLTATATNSVLRFDQVALWQALPLTAVTAHDATASITITLRELTAGQLITVYRVTADGSRTLVRGPSGLLNQAPIAGDLMVIEDYEAPLGTPVSYRIETLAVGSTTPGVRISDTITIAPGDINTCWLKDPGNPQRNLRLLVQAPPSWKRPIPQSVHRVRGRRNAVVLSGIRAGYEADLTVWTRSDDEADALNWILDSGSVLLWQVAPGVHETDRYVTVGEVSLPRAMPRADEEWRAWTLPLTEADMPTAVGVAGSAGRTWQDVLTGFTTWGSLPATYTSWEAALFDQRTGGG
ncbi:hypothetical protein [Streptomyces ehimensis]|uniref:Minor tail protein n=1 Tax=Streptomyces ehimensis TaxID=68195 RepID=A0ABV9BES7_9ACTN